MDVRRIAPGDISRGALTTSFGTTPQSNNVHINHELITVSSLGRQFHVGNFYNYFKDEIMESKRKATIWIYIVNYNNFTCTLSRAHVLILLLYFTEILLNSMHDNYFLQARSHYHVNKNQLQKPKLGLNYNSRTY